MQLYTKFKLDRSTNTAVIWVKVVKDFKKRFFEIKGSLSVGITILFGLQLFPICFIYIHMYILYIYSCTHTRLITPWVVSVIVSVCVICFINKGSTESKLYVELTAHVMRMQRAACYPISRGSTRELGETRPAPDPRLDKLHIISSRASECSEPARKRDRQRGGRDSERESERGG